MCVQTKQDAELACSGVMEKAGMGMVGSDSRCGAMALKMMLRSMPAASS